MKNGVGAAQDAYNAAYNGYMDNYNKRKNAKQWDSSHKDLRWDDDNGWVPKAKAAPASGSRAGRCSREPYPAITSGQRGQQGHEAGRRRSRQVHLEEHDRKSTASPHHRNIHRNRSLNGKDQQKQVITETSRQMVDGVLKDIKTITEVAADGTKTVKQTMETVRRETAKTVTSTF